MSSRATTTPAPWRFDDFRKMPRGCPPRIAAAARIRRLRRLRPLTPKELRLRKIEDEAEQRKHRKRLIWLKRFAIGCVETGELFVSPLAAAEYFTARGCVVSARTIQRSCNDGRWVSRRRLRFVWINGMRWNRKNAWNSAGAVGCMETGELFLTCAAARRKFGGGAAGIHYQDIAWSARSGAEVRGFHFVWLEVDKRRRAESWRRKKAAQNATGMRIGKGELAAVA